MSSYPIESYTQLADHASLNDARVFPNEPDTARHVFVWPEKPDLLNAWNNTHHRVRAQHRAAWREPFRLMAQNCQPLAWCHITVDHLTATRRSVDVAACIPSFKAALDGVVLAGVLEDDGPGFVRSVTFHAPVFDGRDALIVTLTGPLRD